jgi:hypothetical protein
MLQFPAFTTASQQSFLIILPANTLNLFFKNAQSFVKHEPIAVRSLKNLLKWKLPKLHRPRGLKLAVSGYCHEFLEFSLQVN